MNGFPAPLTITWQLVRGAGWQSATIGWFGGDYYSHIDVVTPEGLLRGARSDWIKGIAPGYRDRPQGYEWWVRQTRFTLRVTPMQWKKYWEWSDAHLGCPYDERGLLLAFVFGFKHKLRDNRGKKWVGWCSQEVALNGEHAGLWELPPAITNVNPGDLAFTFARDALRTEVIF